MRKEKSQDASERRRFPEYGVSARSKSTIDERSRSWLLYKSKYRVNQYISSTRKTERCLWWLRVRVPMCYSHALLSNCTVSKHPPFVHFIRPDCSNPRIKNFSKRESGIWFAFLFTSITRSRFYTLIISLFTFLFYILHYFPIYLFFRIARGNICILAELICVKKKKRLRASSNPESLFKPLFNWTKAQFRLLKTHWNLNTISLTVSTPTN